MSYTYEQTRRGYRNLWRKCEVRAEKRATVQRVARGIADKRARYEAVAETVGCPWYVVAVIHHLESGGDFSTHLHNGDPLSARTRRVPAGRPVAGSPPFTWTASAVDALRYMGFHRVPDWPLPRVLRELERYNGFGYFQHGVNSPYLWSFTTLYSRGKYVADGRFSASAVSKQVGAAAILKELIAMSEIKTEAEDEDHMEALKADIDAFGHIAPTVVSWLAGENARHAVKALAEAFEMPEGGDDAEAVRKKVNDTPLSGIAETLSKAEDLLARLMPAEPPDKADEPSETPPAPEKKPANEKPEPGSIDSLFPSWMTGKKTVLGAVIFVATWIVESTGVGGSMLNPVILEVIALLAGALGVTGIVAKIERWVEDGLKSLRGART